MESTANTSKVELTKGFIYDKYQARELSCDDLVEIVILIFTLLNFKTISEYAKQVGKTYSGVERHCKEIKHINQFKFVKDNE
jgi:hypothetical protein